MLGVSSKTGVGEEDGGEWEWFESSLVRGNSGSSQPPHEFQVFSGEWRFRCRFSDLWCGGYGDHPLLPMLTRGSLDRRCVSELCLLLVRLWRWPAEKRVLYVHS